MTKVFNAIEWTVNLKSSNELICEYSQKFYLTKK